MKDDASNYRGKNSIGKNMQFCKINIVLKYCSIYTKFFKVSFNIIIIIIKSGLDQGIENFLDQNYMEHIQIYRVQVPAIQFNLNAEIQ